MSDYYWENQCQHIIGAKILSITGLKKGSEEVVFETDRGTMRMLHEPDCCETVEVEDFTGDAASLIGQTVVVFEARSNSDDPPAERDYLDDSYTWTFYEIRTTGGDMQIRWFGESNGWYGEEAELRWEAK